jgi:hypothetical protein
MTLKISCGLTGPSINGSPAFIHALARLAQRHMQGWDTARGQADERAAEAARSRALALLGGLGAGARARQGRVPRCALQMRHEPRHRADDTTPASTTLELALAEPSADADHLQGLLRERLDRLVLPAPVASFRAIRIRPGFAASLALSSFSRTSLPRLPISGATSVSQIAVSAASIWQ